MINYTNILRQHHLKATPQRVAIANELHNNSHITIEKLYSLLLKKFASISLATVYKNINLMIENNFIQEVTIPHNKSVYELSKETHSHLLCIKCNAIEDITLNLGKTLQSASKVSSYHVKHVDLVLSGLCPKCQKL